MIDGRTISQSTLTLVLAGGQGKRLLPLTAERPKSVVPVGGVFRLIDFTLSNCFNSGLRRLFLLTQYRYESLHRYIRDGWSALWNRKQGDTGEYIICLPPVSGKRYRGSADAMFQNLDLIQRESPNFVLVLSSDQIYQMDYTDLLQHHARSLAAVTIAEIEQPSARSANMGAYVFSTGPLIDALQEDAAQKSNHGVESDIVPLVIERNGVSIYQFHGPGKGAAPYWRDVRTIDSYYESNMDLAQARMPLDPYTSVLSRVRRKAYEILPPSKNVRNCVISPEVYIAPDAEVDSSVVLRGARIGSGARVRRAIVEEGVEIPAGTEIGFNPARDAARYKVSEKGVVVVAKDRFL
jgi:glucose-1-phosphate adenylyltransferase